MSRGDGVLRLVAQPDHAAVAGRLAQQWGGSAFVTPRFHDGLVCAATHHDDGWLELDGRPMFNPDAGRPAHFIELPLTLTAGPYARGVESVYARDELAGALVSMHFSGFYTSRWGVGGGEPSDNPLALEVVATQEARWMPALRAAWANRGRRSEFDVAVWHAYEILQAVDLMSLALCLMDSVRPADLKVVDVASVLSQVDRVAGPRSVKGVPRDAGGRYETIELRCVDAGVVELDPWPLRGDSHQVTIPARELEDRSYADAQDAGRAFGAAAVREAVLTLRPSSLAR